MTAWDVAGLVAVNYALGFLTAGLCLFEGRAAARAGLVFLSFGLVGGLPLLAAELWRQGELQLPGRKKAPELPEAKVVDR